MVRFTFFPSPFIVKKKEATLQFYKQTVIN